MIDVITAAAGVVTMLFAVLTYRPVTQCPRGWHHNGVRRDGRFTCTRTPIGDDYRDARGIVHDTSVVPPGSVEGWVLCTGGAQPIIVDYRTVGCQRGGWQ